MHESLPMYTFLERKFREKYNGDINFLPKITMPNKVKNLKKICKKVKFLPYLAWNSKNQQKLTKMRKRNI